MKFISLFVAIIAFLVFLMPCLAQEDTPKKYIVKLVYFVAKDREPQKGIDTKIEKTVTDAQKFYGDEMEKYGYERKTFRWETDTNGDIVVHHVTGKKDGTHYHQKPYDVFNECARRIQTPNTILFVVLDHGRQRIKGFRGVTYAGARILVPTGTGRWDHHWYVTAHELGHAFGLPHALIDGRPRMSYGKCAAAWLNLNPYFNGGRIRKGDQGVKVELIPSVIAYPPDNMHIFFKITDPDGLYLVRFRDANRLLHSCQSISGEQAIVQLDTSTVRGKVANVAVVDLNGNAKKLGLYSFSNIKPNLIVDISGEVTDVPDQHNNNIRGPWLWMIAPTKQNQGGKDSTHIDSLAVVSANTINEETISKYGANKGDTVGAYKWTLGRLPSDGNINTMLVKKGMTENTDLDDYTAYALTTLVSKTDQSDVMMRVGSDDSIKVWLNGEVVFSNAVIRVFKKNSDVFPVNLKKGDNLLLVKVSDRDGGWGMHVGVDAEVFPVYRVPTTTSAYGVALGGVCNLTPEMSNPSADIAYTLTVINTGNVKDTIKLTTSGNTTAYLRSKEELGSDDILTDMPLSSVSLASGASSKVTLVVPGSVRANAGVYVVKVTATSESDSTKTAEIITTATVR